MYQQPKSATTAGLLGIFLGSVGAHNWYLGEKSKGIAHVCMMSGGILVNILASLILPNIFGVTMLLQMAWLFTILTGIAGLAMSASAIWGLVEGIMILTQGDAGLAAKGYPVAMPAQGVPMNNNYGQPMNNMNNGMNMGANSMGGMNGMNNGMNMGANGMNGMNNISNMGSQMNNGMSPQMNNMGGVNYNSMPTEGATNGINNTGGTNNDTINTGSEASGMQNSINSDAGQPGENTGSNNANDSNGGN